MLGFPNEEAEKKAWDIFGSGAEWRELSQEEEYKDALSNVTNVVLRPAPGIADLN